MITYFIILASVSVLLFPIPAYAHCPLCTIGAGAITIFASWLGVSNIIIGLFMGAFAIALGSWFSKLIKKKYIPYQRWVIEFIFYLSIILPLLVISDSYTSVYISIFGDYGSFLNRTYLINFFFIGSLVGATLVAVSPFISKRISKIRGKTLSYQGLIVTFTLLIIASIILELLN